MEVGRHASDFLQRIPGQAGGDVVDAARQLVAHGSRQVRSSAVRLLALECATSVGVCIRCGDQCGIRKAPFNSTSRETSRCCVTSYTRSTQPTHSYLSSCD